MRVLVLGGGVIGTTTAYFLARAGHEVSVIDRAPQLASECSHANGGMLHASHTEPWNTPAIVGQLFKWVGRSRSPLLVRFDQLPSLAGWGLGFLRFSQSKHHTRNTLTNARLATYSQAQMRVLNEEVTLDYDFANRGILKVFRSRKALDRARRVSELVSPMGIAYRLLDPGEIIDLDPALAGARSELVGGIYHPSDCSGDARLFTRSLGEHLAAQGVEFHMETTIQSLELSSFGVTGVATDKGTFEADRYVLATGVEAPAMVERLGINLPIRPVKGYSVTLPLEGMENTPDIPLIDDERKVVMTRLGDRLRISGIAEFAGFDRSIITERCRFVLEQGLANYPDLAPQVNFSDASLWACLRPMTVDGPPILGHSPVPNLFLNTGSGYLGWTFAAGASRVVADLVEDREPEVELSGLDYDRYNTNTLTLSPT